MKININAIDIISNKPAYLTMQNIKKKAMQTDVHLHNLEAYIVDSWSSSRADVKQDMTKLGM